MNPRPYIEKHRMKLATKLLQHTGTRASITCIASAVGYPDSSHFSQRYEKFTGHRPSLEPKADSKDTILLLEQLRREAEAKRQGAPNYESMALPARRLNNDSSSPGEGVNAFWEEVRGFNREQALDYFRANISILGTHHFDFILEKSKLEGRRSRERGEELAVIALGCLRAIEFREGRNLWDEKVLGYAVLANARRLRLDFVGAKEAFQEIDKFRLDDVRRDVVLQLNIFKAYFHWWWKRDVDSSRKIVDPLLPEVRSYGSFEFLATTLSLAGEIHEAGGEPYRAVAMFEEAAECSFLTEDPYIKFGTHYNLAYLYANLSNAKKASDVLVKLNHLAHIANYRSFAIHLTLLEARIYRVSGNLRDAEPGFLEAREGFASLGLEIYAALASLELSLIYLDLAKPEQAFLMARSSMDFMSRYSSHREATAALAVLQEATGTATINKAMMKRALRHLEMVRKDPLALLLPL
jgi:AraC-like DNA-binding protein